LVLKLADLVRAWSAMSATAGTCSTSRRKPLAPALSQRLDGSRVPRRQPPRCRLDGHGPFLSHRVTSPSR